MKDQYTTAFFRVIKDTQETTGYELPEDIEAYIVMLLASHVDKIDFLPEKPIAIEYLSLRGAGDYRAKELGDTCLFISGVFPYYKRKHGLNKRYYADIGSSSYSMTAETFNTELFTALSNNFEFLGEFIERAIRSTPTLLR
jgi:hypothetical protein